MKQSRMQPLVTILGGTLFWIGACQTEPAGQPDPVSIEKSTPTAHRNHAKHALLIVIDTLRADAQTAAQTPVIDTLAAQGTSVPKAWAAGTWTAPSVFSLFTGAPIRQHGWDLATGQIGHYPTLPDMPTIATVLTENGFDCDALFTNPYLAEKIGFNRGFKTWKRTVDRSLPKRFAKDVQQSWSDGKRHFAYLHFIGPHSPVKPSDESRARWKVDDGWFDDKGGINIGAAKRNREAGVRKAYSDAYHAVIEDTDARLGAVIDALGSHRSETLIVVTSDHGELLGEHDKMGHGHWLWEGLTHVPLVVADPALAPGELELPAVLSNAAVPHIMTESLGVSHTWPTTLQSSTSLVAQREGQIAILEQGKYKGIWHKDTTLEVFDLSTDPHEETPLANTHKLSAAKANWESTTPMGPAPQEPVALDQQTIDELKQLGYLDQE